MLIDGGPASTEPMYTTDIQSRVKFNLFYTLNRLSGSTLAAGTAPPANAMKKIDTLVLTHDDVDHKQGIVHFSNSSKYF
jgi:phosphoribosyl 1,2-cyclic phosphodiesterase